jgi:uncharacterized protein
MPVGHRGATVKLEQLLTTRMRVVMTEAVIDERARSRYVLNEDGEEAELIYDRDEDRLYLLHTLVPPALSGRGLGADLVHSALEVAQRDGLVIVPWCPFARRWLREHPAVAAGAAIDWDLRPPATA